MQPSAFLPAGYDPKRPVALIAGQGIYPVLVASAIRDNVGWIDQIYVLPGMTGTGTGARRCSGAATR